MPTGSGLLSGHPFGGASVGPKDANGKSEGTNIWLTFPILGQDNVTINFAREVERKYGFAALHPRLAAHQERLKAVAAAGAAIEREQGVKGDDVSVDMSENEDVSDVQMGGTEGGINGEEQPQRKRRKRKEEEYDKDDDFIDDTELAWEAQALQAKDGFFVYSGPLVPPEAKVTVERYVNFSNPKSHPQSPTTTYPKLKLTKKPTQSRRHPPQTRTRPRPRRQYARRCFIFWPRLSRRRSRQPRWADSSQTARYESGSRGYGA